jgi:integrase
MEPKMNFKTQSENFLNAIQTRRREPATESTVVSYRSALNAHILPTLGSMNLAKIENGTLKALVVELSNKGLKAATITKIIAVVKLVIASAVDQNGNQLFPRVWNNDFMDLPIINQKDQTAPVAPVKAIQEAISQANPQDRALYALLAGTGLRIGEALALTSADWDRDNMTLSVTKTVSQGAVREGTKTEAGNRQVDLHPDLNKFLIAVLPADGLLFQSETSSVLRTKTLYRHLGETKIPGFHSLRRFRITQLRKTQVPEGLVQFWAGHAGETITDRYDKISQDLPARKLWAQKAGLGFRLEASCTYPNR